MGILLSYQKKVLNQIDAITLYFKQNTLLLLFAKHVPFSSRPPKLLRAANDE